MTALSRKDRGLQGGCGRRGGGSIKVVYVTSNVINGFYNSGEKWSTIFVADTIKKQGVFI